MAYDLVGCMELHEGKYRPRWVNPCTSGDIRGCMELFEGKYRPRLDGGFGSCPNDKTGCMELHEGKYRPVLTFDEYNSLEEMQHDCCVACENCWDLYSSPRYIEVTFAGITWCPGDGGGWPSPNRTFVLEYDETFTACWECSSLFSDCCGWRTNQIISGKRFWVVIMMYTKVSTGDPKCFVGLTGDSGVVGCGGCLPGSSSEIFRAFPSFSCLDTDFVNQRVPGTCGITITQGQGGTALVVWDP